jgi:hypothetical protein
MLRFTAMTLSGAYLLVQLELIAAPAKDSTICLAIAHPVCGRGMDGVERTYDNECVARGAKVISFADGPCKIAKPNAGGPKR